MNTAHQEPFIKFPKTLLAATHWLSLTTGEDVQFTPSNKILWLHIKDRFDFFTSLGNEWFDNQEAIAAATGSNISTVKRFLADLTKHGYLKTSKKKVWGALSPTTTQSPKTLLELFARRARL